MPHFKPFADPTQALQKHYGLNWIQRVEAGQVPPLTVRRSDPAGSSHDARSSQC